MAREDGEGEQPKEGINPIVFYGSSLGIVAFALWTIIATEQANTVINTILAWISTSFGWFYFLAVLAYLIFVLIVGLSRFGDLKLGPAHSKPEFNIVSWATMLFAAGIGIDLLFFSVSEPVTQFLEPPEGEGGSPEAARHAIELTYLHWGLSGWGIYTLVGMSLAFFSFRHGLPLTVRSALYPLLGRHIYGPVGHAVDIAAVLGTIFGVATSLGIGIIQLTFGLNYMFGIPETVLVQASLAALIVVFSAISAVSGVARGIRRLSEFNMGLAFVLMLFVLISGKTLFLLDALVTNVGDYLSGFISLSTNTYPFDPPREWLNAWTVFFWAWWIAWGPFVGLFLARISRGRTIRQFVAGTLILPLSFMMAWMGTMGNSAIDLVMNDAGVSGFAEQAVENPGSSIYLFMQSMPWSLVTTIVVSILAIVFFITSGDSGSLVLSNLTSVIRDPNEDAAAWMRILWAGIIGLLTVALLLADGLEALQSTVVIMGLPFAFVLFLMMLGLFRALRVEGLKQDAAKGSLSGHLSGRTVPGGGRNWRDRLARTLSLPGHAEAQRFLRETARPAMEQLRDGLKQEGFQVEVVEETGDNEHLALNVYLEGEQDFTYQIWPYRCATPTFYLRTAHSLDYYYRLEVHIAEGGQGYDVYGYTQDQLIADIIDQYEQHLHFLHSQRVTPGGDAIMPDDPGTAGR